LEYGDEKMKAYLGISSTVLRTARENLKDALLIDFVSGGRGFRVKTRYKILTPKLASKLEPLYNKTKTIDNISNSSKNEKYSKREFIASGSDFDQ
jgi:hypothetical protein